MARPADPDGLVLYQGGFGDLRRGLCGAALVYQGGVEQFGWLTGTQMIDGMALGEETAPGPLIMAVAFVGFVGGWVKEVFGADHLALAGIADASVATLFTSLSSFLFILVGAPAVEATRHDIKFSAH